MLLDKVTDVTENDDGVDATDDGFAVTDTNIFVATVHDTSLDQWTSDCTTVPENTLLLLSLLASHLALWMMVT